MKRLIFLKALFVLAVITTSISCTKEYILSNDNHIISFNLILQDVTYKAAITDDKIVISIPKGVSLQGATAEVVISENSTIAPDPLQITNWDQEEQFVVTSNENVRKSYIYCIERTSVVTKGNVVLLTQADVDAFAQTGATIIDGNLTIAATSGNDTIFNLNGLAELTRVVHNITINNNYVGEDIEGLSKLENAGEINIALAPKLKSVELPNLTTIGTNLSIASTLIESVRMPELTSVGKNFTVKSDALKSCDFSELQTIAGAMLFNGTNTSVQNNTMESVSFPKLKSVEGAITMNYWTKAVKLDAQQLSRVGGLITMQYWNKLEKVSIPKLESIGGLTLSNCAALVDIDFSILKNSNGNVSFSTLSSVTSLFINSLEQINGGLTLNLAEATGVSFNELISVSGTLSIPSGATNLTAPYFPKLKYIGKDLDIRSTKIVDLSSFSKLEEIGERLYLYGATSITSLSGLTSLKKVGTSYYLYNLLSLTELDVRGVKTPLISMYGSTLNNLTVTGDDIFEGKLYFGSPLSTLTQMPSLVGFRVVEDFAVSSNSYKEIVSFSGIEQVNGLLDFTSCNSTPTVSMPNLQKAGGIKLQYCNALTTIDLPELEAITGDDAKTGLYHNVSSPIENIDMPKLKSVIGNVSITGLTAARNKLESINMPLIESISGTLTITGTNNNGLKSVANFSGLKVVESVNISNFTNLVDFEGLKNSIPALNASSWKILGCGYNPTYKDMVDGIYSKQ